MLKEKAGVKEWQLNRVSDGFDLRTQTANIVIRDIRDIFEHEVFDLGAREFLERDFVRSIDPHGITRAQHLAAKCIADRYDSFLVCPTADHTAVDPEHLDDRHDRASLLSTAHHHDI